MSKSRSIARTFGRIRGIYLAGVIIAMLCVALAATALMRLARQIAREDAILQGVADELGRPILVHRGAGLAPFFLYATTVDLPEVSPAQIDDAARAINKLSRVHVVIVRRANLERTDLNHFRSQLRRGIFLGESMTSTRRIVWEVVRPKLKGGTSIDEDSRAWEAEQEMPAHSAARSAKR